MGIARFVPMEKTLYSEGFKGYTPSSLGTRLFPVDRMTGLADENLLVFKILKYDSGQNQQHFIIKFSRSGCFKEHIFGRHIFS